MTTDAAPQRLILVSDDDARSAGALARMFRVHGIETLMDVASDVERLAVRYRPSLIVLDLNQKVDGRTLLARLKRNGDTRSIPVVVLSGIDHPRVRSYCLALGALEYATKPADASFVTHLSQLPALSGGATPPNASAPP